MKEKKYLKITPPKGDGNVVVVPYSSSTVAFYKARNITFEEEKSDKRYKIEDATTEEVSNFNLSSVKNDVSSAEKEATDKAKNEAYAMQAKLDEVEKAKQAAEKAEKEATDKAKNEAYAMQAKLDEVEKAKQAAEKAEKEATDKAKNLEDKLKAVQAESKKTQDEKAKK